MRHTVIAAIVLTGLAAPAAAIEPTVGPGEMLETRLDTDLNGDGTADLAYIVNADDWRELRVQIAGRNAVEALDLSTDPLGAGELAMAGNVLTFTDLTGGTTAYASTRRYRFDGTNKRMRLIGMDVTFYSRTFSHDGYETSWNLLTGEGKAHAMRLTAGAQEDRAYDEVHEVSFRRRTRAVWLSDTPDPEELLEEMRED
jgi:hypothetical protein